VTVTTAATAEEVGKEGGKTGNGQMYFKRITKSIKEERWFRPSTNILARKKVKFNRG
jgi:hypothetical protein